MCGATYSPHGRFTKDKVIRYYVGIRAMRTATGSPTVSIPIGSSCSSRATSPWDERTPRRLPGRAERRRRRTLVDMALLEAAGVVTAGNGDGQLGPGETVQLTAHTAVLTSLM